MARVERVLRNGVALVTGASSGIGRAVALALAREGCDVVLAARRQERLEEVARGVEAHGRRALALRCDVTSPADVEALATRVRERFGRLDVLVNNAGVGLFGALEATRPEQLRHVFDVNVFGLVAVTRAVLPLLRAHRGSQVVNVSSTLGHRGLPLLGGYCASKAAVNALTESLRSELLPEGIDVLLVSPGITETEFQDVRLHAEGFGPEQLPFKGMPAEVVAEAIVDACRRRRRRTVLTLQGKVLVHGNRLVPGLMDRVAPRLVGAPRTPPP
ncbi:MAG: SDR family oxidoreductase [Myxococcaceae bacterium]|nr:SDR family oxidoreductase [Myxococcaceae bacterium]MCI0672477.1 SDR family oxidoreductase [Myxococcaceae bacterium]